MCSGSHVVGGSKQHGKQRFLIRTHDLAKLIGQRKDHVKVRHWEQEITLSFN